MSFVRWNLGKMCSQHTQSKRAQSPQGAQQFYLMLDGSTSRELKLQQSWLSSINISLNFSILKAFSIV
jgi:hypothetical protein